MRSYQYIAEIASPFDSEVDFIYISLILWTCGGKGVVSYVRLEQVGLG
jgi:hypothetical protein